MSEMSPVKEAETFQFKLPKLLKILHYYCVFLQKIIIYLQNCNELP